VFRRRLSLRIETAFNQTVIERLSARKEYRDRVYTTDNKPNRCVCPAHETKDSRVTCVLVIGDDE
jgi:hypothetical protein